jgi:hypothetical protein
MEVGVSLGQEEKPQLGNQSLLLILLNGTFCFNA